MRLVVRERERGREHADDRGGDAVELNDFGQDRRATAEAILPKLVGNDGGIGTTDLVVCRSEVAAEGDA